MDCVSGYRTDGPPELAPAGESAFAAEQAAQSAASPGARIAAIVGFADLTLGDRVRPVLEAHLEAGAGKFRGIRHATSWDASPQLHNAHTNPPEGVMGTDGFRQGLAVLAGMGLTFDAWMYHPQLPELVDLARELPDATIILDHLGGPVGIGPYAGRREEVLAAWRPPMERLAKLPNVYLKVGGIGMAAVRLGVAQAPDRAVLRRAGGRLGRRDALVHRPLRPEPLHVRVELPRRPPRLLLRGPLERLQEDRDCGRLRRGGDRGAVPRHRGRASLDLTAAAASASAGARQSSSKPSRAPPRARRR